MAAGLLLELAFKQKLQVQGTLSLILSPFLTCASSCCRTACLCTVGAENSIRWMTAGLGLLWELRLMQGF